MKFRRLVLVVVVALISIAVAGCSSETKAPQHDVVAAMAENEKVVMPQEQPSLMGKVNDIVGNEVTVFKGEVTQAEGISKAEPATEESQEKINAVREKIASNTITPEQAREDFKNLGIQVNPAQNRLEFTEETETFIIPVGTPIVTIQRGTNEANQVELADIKKDTILRIWKKGDVVEFVQLMGGTGGGFGNREGMGDNGERTGGGYGMGPIGGMGGNRRP